MNCLPVTQVVVPAAQDLILKKKKKIAALLRSMKTRTARAELYTRCYQSDCIFGTRTPRYEDVPFRIG